jgi:hypothetical protein
MVWVVLEGWKAGSPPYAAASTSLPSSGKTVVRDATPPMSGVVPSVWPLVVSVKVTDPVGVPPPDEGATVARRVVLCPSTADVGVRVVEVGTAGPFVSISVWTGKLT